MRPSSAFLFGALAMMMLPRLARGQAGPCWIVDDQLENLLATSRALLVSTDSATARFRAELRLARLTDSLQVAVVLDPGVCRAALDSIRSIHPDSVRPRLTTAMVISAGPGRYFVWVSTWSPRGPRIFILDERKHPYASF